MDPLRRSPARSRTQPARSYALGFVVRIAGAAGISSIAARIAGSLIIVLHRVVSHIIDV